jgi:heme exporter protein C
MTAIDLGLARFLSFAGRVLPWLAAATLLAFGLGLALSLAAPDDYWQGATVKIMFLHVPSAWLITLIWVVMSIAAVATLAWRHPLARCHGESRRADRRRVHISAPRHGSLWERPMLGAYWVWDGRQTSVLVLFLMYLGLIVLYWTEEHLARVARLDAVLVLAGAVMLPVIRFSVVWWNTLHQPAALGGGATPAMHSFILTPLLLMALAFVLLFVTLHVAAMRNEILRQRACALRLMQAEMGATVDQGVQ